MSKNGMMYVDPNTAIHPTRNSMSEEDWDRMDRIVGGNSDEDCSTEEIEAYQDWLYDQIAAKIQTHEGVVTLQ